VTRFIACSTSILLAAVCVASCAKQPAATARPQLLSVEDAAWNDPSAIAKLEMQEPARAMPARWVLQACIGEANTCLNEGNAGRID
jgi:hypothetical protein